MNNILKVVVVARLKEYPLGERLANLMDAVFLASFLIADNAKAWFYLALSAAVFAGLAYYMGVKLLFCAIFIVPFPVLFVKYLVASYFCDKCFLFSSRIKEGRCPDCRGKPRAHVS